MTAGFQSLLNRRQFLQATGATAAGLAFGVQAAEENIPTAAKLPRWRGFNLLEKFTVGHNAAFRESDFEWIAELGFDFARLPLSYHCWADPNEPLTLRENALKEIDQ